MERLKAIEELLKHDHSFLSEEGAKEICEPFEIKPELYEARDTRSEFKGLTLYGVNPKTGKEYKEGDTCLGIDADVLASQVAKHLGVEFAEMFGKGSRLRSACEAIKEFLKKEK